MESTIGNEEYSATCRGELTNHVKCVKLFLEEHVKYGSDYDPLQPTQDHCRTTRDIFYKCMKERVARPQQPQSKVTHSQDESFKPCAMELAMHGSCVGLFLERSFRTNKKYFTEGGEDKCDYTRNLYKKCMQGVLAGKTDHWNPAADTSASATRNWKSRNPSWKLDPPGP